ncbi:MAG: PilZ domain-containing protein [Spirochaetales bacterium]|nr:PilZ domain-containing protein [Spirochaetales bacterium]
MENRRKNSRFRLHQIIEMSCFSENFIHVSSVDMSINGMQFVTSEPIEHEAKVFLMFEIPDGQESYMIKCEGVHMWQKSLGDSYQSGVLFTTLTETDKIKINSYLESLEEGEKDENEETPQDIKDPENPENEYY